MERAAPKMPKLCEPHEPRGKVLEFRVRLQEPGVQERLARLEGLIDGVTMLTQSTLLHLVPAEPPFGLRALCKMEVHRESLRDKPSEVSRKIPRPRRFCGKCMDLAARVSVSR